MLARTIMTAAIAALLAGCGGDDETCGPEGAPAEGITITTPEGTVTYGAFTSSANNDCTPPDGSATSITLDGVQASPAPTGFPPHLAFCIPRPDEISAGAAIPLNLADLDDIQLIDASGEVGGCTYSLDRTVTPTGSITLTGYCGDGLDAAGYALALSGDVALTLSCPDAQPVTATFGGTAAVDAL